jgi:hypothetical protein
MEQLARLNKFAVSKALGEPAVNWGKKVTSLLALALACP